MILDSLYHVDYSFVCQYVVLFLHDSCTIGVAHNVKSEVIQNQYDGSRQSAYRPAVPVWTTPIRRIQRRLTQESGKPLENSFEFYDN